MGENNTPTALKGCGIKMVLQEAQISTNIKASHSVVHPIQQPRSYWDRSTAFATCGGGGTHTEVTACDEMPKLLNH